MECEELDRGFKLAQIIDIMKHRNIDLMILTEMWMKIPTMFNSEGYTVFHSADAAGLEGQSLVPCAVPLIAGGTEPGGQWEPGVFANDDGDVQLKYIGEDSPIGTGVGMNRK